MPMRSFMPGNRRWPGRTRWLLSLFVFVALPIAVVMGGLATWNAVRMYRTQLELTLANFAQSHALIIDARLAGFAAAATVLAQSDHLLQGEHVEEVYREAAASARALDGWVVITWPGQPNRPLFNTLNPEGTASPPPEAGSPMLAAEAAAQQTGKPQFYSTFESSLGRKPAMAVVLAVMRDSEPRAFVHVAFSSDVLSRALGEGGLPEGSFAAAVSELGRVIASTSYAPAFIGQAPLDWSPTIRVRGVGLEERASITGQPRLFAYRALRLAPEWHVTIGMPLGLVTTMTWAGATQIALAGCAIAALLLLALGLLWASRREQHAAFTELEWILADIPTIIYVNRVTQDGKFERRFLSHSAEAVTGWPMAELERSGSLAALADEDAAESRAAYFRTALSEGRASMEYRLRHADGIWHWMRSTCVCLNRDAAGGYLVGCISDITEERQTQERLRQSEKLAVLGEVAANIAHEINQPLSLISMTAENGLRALNRVPLDLPADLPPVLAIDAPLQQVLLNLVTNACDAYTGTPAGGIRTVCVSASAAGRMLCISVGDSAGGIAPELLPGIFEPFVTTKAVGKGTGLGLSISLATVSALGGRIDVSNVDGGTRFAIFLPAVKDAA